MIVHRREVQRRDVIRSHSVHICIALAKCLDDLVLPHEGGKVQSSPAVFVDRIHVGSLRTQTLESHQ